MPSVSKGWHQELLRPPWGTKVATAGSFVGLSKYTPMCQRLVKWPNLFSPPVFSPDEGTAWNILPTSNFIQHPAAKKHFTRRTSLNKVKAGKRVLDNLVQVQYKNPWGGLKWFFSKDKPLQAKLELAFFLPQGLFFSFSNWVIKSWLQQNRKTKLKSTLNR